MKYNLSPIIIKLPEDSVWPRKLERFFYNENYDPYLRDWYYDCLIRNVPDVHHVLNQAYLIDHYSGLFSFGSMETDGHHSFNVANLMRHTFFPESHRKLLTLTADYGILNIQAKLKGLEVVSSFQRDNLNVGTVLACIGNGSSPYPINHGTTDYNAIIASCVFTDEDLAWRNWNFLVDERTKGKLVYFTTNTFVHLRNYINYERIQLVENPLDIYDESDYSDLIYGYMNKIYKLV